ncbi:MAG TPA: polyamine aminopropyltransferase [Bacillota bacterium]|nr:polyamine aminopropyltransferase [Bacillota bacterium]
MATQEWNWYVEYTSPHHGYMYAVRRHIYSGETPYQRVDLIDTFIFGRCLILDGRIQSAAVDEHIYHEALIHPALVLHRNPKRALVMGGGEGAVLRELCRHPGLEQVVMVDIDREVVELCRKHLPGWHGNCFDDPRVEVLHMDARRYLEDTKHRYDLIYSDLTEPEEEGPSRLLFTRQFFELVKNRLAPGGILTVQAGCFSIDLLEAHASIRKTLQQCFASVFSYHTYIPSFNANWGFLLASEHLDPLGVSAAEIDRRLDNLISPLKFYDGETHHGMFRVPKDIRSALAQDGKVIDDDEPLSLY